MQANKIMRTAVLAVSLLAANQLTAAPALTATGTAVGVPLEALKLVYVHSFAHFTQWPDDRVFATNAPLVIGVLSSHTLRECGAVLTGKLVRGRPLLLRHCATPRDADGCHILFLNDADDLRQQSFLAHTAGSPVLTVGEDDGFLRAGGMIRLRLADRKLRFEINAPAAARAGIKLSAQLLEIGKQREREASP